MPYDQFVIEQLAGDMLPNATLTQQIASGFGRNHRINSEDGSIPEEDEILQAIEDARESQTHDTADDDARGGSDSEGGGYVM